jgi:N-acetylmuramoyl-L-alanine amidase
MYRGLSKSFRLFPHIGKMKISLRLLALLLLLTSFAVARPIADGEFSPGSAVHKGQTGVVQAPADFPHSLLKWAYKPPQFIPWFLDYRRWENHHLKYFKKTYGVNSLYFKPSMLVMHYTVVPTAEQTYSVLQRRRVSVHFMVDRDGTIYQLLPLDRRCTGAYGVNHKAISVEMVAATESDLLSRPYQVFRSFCLARYLMAMYHIPSNKVVGHSEVGEGVSRVPEYLDLADPYYPTRYPPSSKRTDPGDRYMRWLRAYLAMEPPSQLDLD